MNSNKFNPQELPFVLSVSELAAVLHIGRNAAYHLVNSGQIRCVRIGKNIRIPQSALMEYLNNCSKSC
jgi:excisionase family DNA binding protein